MACDDAGRTIPFMRADDRWWCKRRGKSTPEDIIPLSVALSGFLEVVTMGNENFVMGYWCKWGSYCVDCCASYVGRCHLEVSRDFPKKLWQILRGLINWHIWKAGCSLSWRINLYLWLGFNYIWLDLGLNILVEWKTRACNNRGASCHSAMWFWCD